METARNPQKKEEAKEAQKQVSCVNKTNIFVACQLQYQSLSIYDEAGYCKAYGICKSYRR